MTVSLLRELSLFKTSCATHFQVEKISQIRYVNQLSYRLLDSTISSHLQTRPCLYSATLPQACFQCLDKEISHLCKSCWWYFQPMFYSQQNLHSAGKKLMLSLAALGARTLGQGRWHGWSRVSAALVRKGRDAKGRTSAATSWLSSHQHRWIQQQGDC